MASVVALRLPVADLTCPIERDITIQASRIELEPPATELRVTVRVTKCGKEALVEGSVQAAITVPCALCLSPATRTVDERLNFSVHIPPGGEIDLTPAVRDAFIASKPMKETCSPDCKGLCPQCGANLNTEPCACATDTGGARKGSLGVALDEALDRGEY